MSQTTSREQMTNPHFPAHFVDRVYARRVLGDERARLALLDSVPPERLLDWVLTAHPGVAAQLLEELSDEQVRTMAPDLANRFFQMPTMVSVVAIERLAEVAPDIALPLVTRGAQCFRSPSRAAQLCAVVRAMRTLGPVARPALEGILSEYRLGRGRYRMYWDGLFVAAADLKVDGLPRMVARLLASLAGPGVEGEELLEEIYEALAPGHPFLSLLYEIEFQRTGYRFADLPELFAPGTRIARLDGFAQGHEAEQMEEVLGRLDDHGPTADLVAFVRALVEHLPESLDEGPRRRVYLLAVAALASQHVRDPGDLAALAVGDLMDLYSSDVASLPWEAKAEAQLLQRMADPDFARLHKELPDIRIYRGAGRVVRLLSRAGRMTSLRPLLGCLFADSDEWGAHEATIALARTGRPALDLIVSRFSRFDEVQAYRALEAIGLMGDADAAEALVSLYPHVRDEEHIRHGWCLAARACPDSRFLTLMADARRGKDKEVARTYDAVKALLAAA